MCMYWNSSVSAYCFTKFSIFVTHETHADIYHLHNVVHTPYHLVIQYHNELVLKDHVMVLADIQYMDSYLP